MLTMTTARVVGAELRMRGTRGDVDDVAEARRKVGDYGGRLLELRRMP